MRHKYRIRRWQGDEVMEDLSVELPIAMDWLSSYYLEEKDWDCLLIEEVDKDGKEIGMFTYTRK